MIAKAPVAGRSKTRLCPPCSPEQAAVLAEAALADTLGTVAAVNCAGRTVVLDGEPGDWLPEGFDVIPQGGGGLGDRLAAAFAGIRRPALLIGMDTPQVTVELLEHALARLGDADTDSVLGLCFDGGYWAIGFDGRRTGVFDGVPMSSAETGRRQLLRLGQLGMTVEELPVLRDVDHFSDAVAAAAECPDSRFAMALAESGLSVA